MGSVKDITNQRFGKLVALKKDETDTSEYAKWICQCDCGKTKSISKYKLLSGHTKSCGCIHKEVNDRIRWKHGMTNTRIYKCWSRMKERCYNPHNADYPNYGGRGIEVCEEWCNSFEAFYEWAMSHGYTDNLTIERIDSNKDYCPGNCTWSDRLQQANNRRYCRMYTYNGKTQNLKQWCKEMNMDYKLVHGRIYALHWTFEKAITTPKAS